MCSFLTSLSVTSGDIDVTFCLFVYITLDKGQCRLKRCVNKCYAILELFSDILLILFEVGITNLVC